MDGSPARAPTRGPTRPLIFVLALALAACGDGTPLQTDDEWDGRPVPRPDAVRGIYVNAPAAGSPSHLGSLIELTEGSDINAFVIDVKERGEVSYSSSVPLAESVGATRGYVPDLPAVLRQLHEHGIYPIARIVVFRDPVLAEARPEWAIRTAGGELWREAGGAPWVDPYRSEVWTYNIDLAREAIEAGFAEIQWDYVRFPDVPDSVRAGMDFPARAGRTPAEAIEEFIGASRSELADLGVPVTADVFGRVIVEGGDSNEIGQDWNRLVRSVDVLLPMVYPALWWPGNFGIGDPNGEPYLTVRAAMDSAVARLDSSPGAVATLRPWLQAYSAGTVTYGADEMLEQARAVEDAGLREWLFWHPGSLYPEGAFRAR